MILTKWRWLATGTQCVAPPSSATGKEHSITRGQRYTYRVLKRNNVGPWRGRGWTKPKPSYSLHIVYGWEHAFFLIQHRVKKNWTLVLVHDLKQDRSSVDIRSYGRREAEGSFRERVRSQLRRPP